MKKILIRYLKRHAWQVIATILIVIISVLLSILPPRILHHIIDNYLKDGLPKTLMILGVLYFSSFLLINVMELIKEIILNVVAQGIIKESKMVMLNKLHKMSYKDLTSFTYGEIEAYFNNDVESINLLITSGFVSFVIDIFKIVGIIISIFLFSISFGLLALSILPFLFLVALLMRKLSFKKQYKMRELEGKGNNKALEMISNSLVLKAMNLTTFVQKDFEHTINEHYSATREAHFVDSIFAPLMQVFKYLAITLVIIISSKNVSLGMEIGVVAACIDYITDLFKPIENLGTEINTMQKSFARIRHLEHFLKLDEEEKKSAISILTPWL